MARPITEIGIARKAAKDRGDKFYKVDSPCPKGHYSPRLVSDGRCLVCIKEKNTVRYWSDPEKARKSIRDKRNDETYRLADAERCRLWRKNNPEKYKASRDSWNLRNAERYRDSSKAWVKNNKEKVYSRQRNRKAKKLAGGSHTASDIADIFRIQKFKCAYCATHLKNKKRSARHVDHIIPLAKGGSNEKRNLQILCRTCNNKKYSKDPIDFARELGRLL